MYAGADPEFLFTGGGGGGAKDYVPARTLRARNQTHFRQGSMQGPLKGPGSSQGCFNTLSCYLSLIFKHSDLKKCIKKPPVDPI